MTNQGTLLYHKICSTLESARSCCPSCQGSSQSNQQQSTKVWCLRCFSWMMVDFQKELGLAFGDYWFMMGLNTLQPKSVSCIQSFIPAIMWQVCGAKRFRYLVWHPVLQFLWGKFGNRYDPIYKLPAAYMLCTYFLLDCERRYRLGHYVHCAHATLVKWLVILSQISRSHTHSIRVDQIGNGWNFQLSMNTIPEMQHWPCLIQPIFTVLQYTVQYTSLAQIPRLVGNLSIRQGVWQSQWLKIFTKDVIITQMNAFKNGQNEWRVGDRSRWIGTGDRSAVS